MSLALRRLARDMSGLAMASSSTNKSKCSIHRAWTITSIRRYARPISVIFRQKTLPRLKIPSISTSFSVPSAEDAWSWLNSSCLGKC
ncbi:SET domain-containing protein [Colletotrichum scovillei]|uniref:SET domain-containing protein n=1 Tax=Colletotrichum scovillei TaxID=1209932 RepID=A0A9P7QR10_9PEZI|nr:SET domain-containing protein [Colletotrichum scovillei]KAG7040973.1 SET domain-containing protein [Colletotrichum scovillei]KAG7061006.1 SET domain-containing protein [Colletotrichum scovillei]